MGIVAKNAILLIDFAKWSEERGMQRREALIEALASHEIGAHGKSGFNVWIPVREEAATVQALAERGWGVAAGERFRLRSVPAIRVTTSALVPDEAERFAADFAAALRSRAAAPA